MKVILLYVISLDGKVTKWEPGHSFEWTSSEEKENFLKILSESKVYIMGSNVFLLGNIKPAKEKLKIVLTRTPEKYKQMQIADQLEFTNEAPKELVNRLQRKGFKELYLICGPELTTRYLKEQLVDELWVSIEPTIFGKGLSMVTEIVDIQLELHEIQKLNRKGLLFLKYKIVK